MINIANADGRKNKKAAFSLIEVLAAALIFALSVAGTYALFTESYIRANESNEIAQSGQLATAEIERAKVYGITNLPQGTYSSSTQTATWTGVYQTSTNTWVSGGTQYFSYQGAPLSSSANAMFSMQDTMTDSNVQPDTTDSGYTFSVTSIRAMVVTVKLVATGAVVFTGGTNIVVGGI